MATLHRSTTHQRAQSWRQYEDEPRQARPRLRRVSDLKLITAIGETPPSFARVQEPTRAPLRVGLVQHRWHPDPDEHRAALAEGVRVAAGEGAKLVCLQELTLSPYFAITADGPRARRRRARAGPRRADARVRRAARARDRRARARLALRARRRRGRPGLQHRDRHGARRHARRAHAQAAHPGHHRLLRGQVLPARARPATTPSRSSSWATRASASRPAGTSGSPSSRAPTRWPAPRSSSTRRRSARSPTTPTSTPSRCGSGSSSPTGSPTAPSWSPSTGSGPRSR